MAQWLTHCRDGWRDSGLFSADKCLCRCVGCHGLLLHLQDWGNCCFFPGVRLDETCAHFTAALCPQSHVERTLDHRRFCKKTEKSDRATELMCVGHVFRNRITVQLWDKLTNNVDKPHLKHTFRRTKLRMRANWAPCFFGRRVLYYFAEMETGLGRQSHHKGRGFATLG